MQSSTVFGQTIRYYDVGSGPVLVLLHGIASSGKDWGKVMEPLSSTNRLLVMDQVGFGASDKPNIEYRIQTYVDFLGEFLRQHSIEQFILAGVSLGGWIAAQYVHQALHRPGRCLHDLPIPNKLLLCDAAGIRQEFTSNLLDGMLPGSEAAVESSLRAQVYDQSLIDGKAVQEEFISRLAANDGLAVRSLVGSFSNSSEWIDDKLQAISIPTLVVWGMEDKIMPLQHGKDFAVGIPKATLVTIEDCGHAPILEKPAEFLLAIKDFIR
jgi:triacylglycerol lipase